jgi:glycosyltransferase involved in cell wall biosynthesis
MTKTAGLRSRLNSPPASRILMAAGDYVIGDGMRMAVWAFDVLKYVAPDLHLVLVGDGPGLDRVLRFARSLGRDDYRVHFLTDDNPLSVVPEADIAWGTHPLGGAVFLRAAMACGIPVVAVRTPDTEDLPGAILSPPGDPVALATATRKVLDQLAPH